MHEAPEWEAELDPSLPAWLRPLPTRAVPRDRCGHLAPSAPTGPPNPDAFNLERVMDIWRTNHLSAASLALTDPPRDLYWPVMKRGWMGPNQERRPNGVGREVRYFDILFSVFSIDTWRCFHSLLDPRINTNGWGMDHLLHEYCSARLGIIDEFAIQHVQNIKGAKRTATGREAFPLFRGVRLDEQAQEEYLICTKLAGCCGSGRDTDAGLPGRKCAEMFVAKPTTQFHVHMHARACV